MRHYALTIAVAIFITMPAAMLLSFFICRHAFAFTLPYADIFADAIDAAFAAAFCRQLF